VQVNTFLNDVLTKCRELYLSWCKVAQKHSPFCDSFLLDELMRVLRTPGTERRSGVSDVASLLQQAVLPCRPFLVFLAFQKTTRMSCI